LGILGERLGPDLLEDDARVARDGVDDALTAVGDPSTDPEGAPAARRQALPGGELPRLARLRHGSSRRVRSTRIGRPTTVETCTTAVRGPHGGSVSSRTPSTGEAADERVTLRCG